MSSLETYRLTSRSGPILISMPHAGVDIPSDLQSCYTPTGLSSEDSDWWVQRLYAPIAEALQCSELQALWSRYVVDLNRPSDDQPLYEQPSAPGLFPDLSFRGAALYLPDSRPSKVQQSQRISTYWQPYHQALKRTLMEIRRRHGFAVLLEAHTIRSKLPRLFSGSLPQINIGTNHDKSFPQSLTQTLQKTVAQSNYSFAWNGRFIGGYNTRHYADLEARIFALQIELSMETYSDERYPAPIFDAERSRQIVGTLQNFIGEVASCLKNSTH